MPQVFKQLPDVYVLRGFTLRMHQMGQTAAQHVDSGLSKDLPVMELLVCVSIVTRAIALLVLERLDQMLPLVIYVHQVTSASAAVVPADATHARLGRSR